MPPKIVLKERPKEMYRVKRAVHDMQKDSDTSDQEFDAIQTKVFNFNHVKPAFITKL